MKPIGLTFRTHLSSNDLNFILRSLGHSPAERTSLLRLLTDPATVDDILDQPALFHAVLDSISPLSLSTRLYFYLLSRHALKNSGLNDPELADYLSGVLEYFSENRAERLPPGNVFYIVDWLNKVESSPLGERYQLYVMAGNQLLFLTGIFPHFLTERSRRRGAPDIQFYVDAGRHSFRSAARHPLSQRSETDNLYGNLAEHFPHLRYALNDLSDRLVSIEPAPAWPGGLN